MAAITMLARAQLRRSLRTMLLLGVMAGIVAGIVLGSVQLARRTATAHERLERATSVPDAVLLSLGGDEQTEQLVRLPQVESSWVTTTGIAQVGGNERRFVGILAGSEAPPPGLFTPIIVRGRRADSAAADEVVLSEHAAKFTGFDVGDRVDLTFLTAEEFTQFDTGFGEPDGPEVDARVVGIARTAIDEGINSIEVYSTPAFAELIDEAGASAFRTVLVRLRDGTASLPSFQRAVRDLGAEASPEAGAEEFAGIEVQVPSRQRSVIAVTVRVQEIGLLVFAGIAGLAGIFGAGMAMRRHFQVTVEPDLAAMSAVGVTNRETRGARLITALPFVASGTVTSVVVAVVLGVLEPIGSMAEQEPDPGWHVNVAILGGGAVAILGILIAVALLAGPVRLRARPAPPRTSGLVEQLAAAGAPPPTVVGTRMALNRGRGRTAVPVRSTLIGTALGVIGLVGVIVFGSSLDRLVDTPARWGWVADALVFDVNDDLTTRLVADRDIEALSLYDEFGVDVEGRAATAEAFTDRKRSVGWTILDGRMPGRGETILGARLARDLGRSTGDHVTVRGTNGRDLRFEVVGVGVGPNLTNQQFGGGLVLAPEDAPRVSRTQPFVNASISLRDGVEVGDFAGGLGGDFEVDRPTRPTDVDNLAQLGALPQLLAAFLALVGIAVLAHLLVTTSRRRRRDLDTLRAMGFVPRQARAVIVTVGLVTMIVGLAVGVPLGIAAGRLSWQLTARSVYVAGDPNVPFLALALFVVGALAVAGLAAAWPAWRAAQGPAARGLREE